uniref:G-patch domain-containing protein n=1 Tax=Strigamia maritima TaxID=126957 RepID=T1J1J8_STRMM
MTTLSLFLSLSSHDDTKVKSDHEIDRKSKWSSNPCGNIWSKDDSKYGQRLLEKMGWSKGKGLGKNEDGNTDHVKTSLKNDAKGLGFNGYDDVWMAHQQDFDKVLSSLNGEEKAGKSSKEIINLTERSQNSKKRVHRYKKMIAGKDLSTKSEKDFKCIFGKSNDEKDNSDADAVFRPNCGSMNDYFAKKLEEKRRKTLDSIQVEETEETVLTKEERRERRKLKKEKKKTLEFNEELYKKRIDEFKDDVADGNEEDSSRKSKKKKIREEIEEETPKKSKVEVVEETSPDILKKQKKCKTEEDVEISPDVQKKKKKKKSKVETDVEITPVVAKKKKSKVEVVEETSPVVVKKKEKSKTEDDVEISLVVQKKKKKSKVEGNEELCPAPEKKKK